MPTAIFISYTRSAWQTGVALRHLRIGMELTRSTRSSRGQGRIRAAKNVKLRILGCSGGIGGRHLRTTSMLVDNDILIDAGTGVADLSLSELSLIDHVFVTHSHLDHIVTIPFIVDTVGGMRAKPLTVYAIPATIEILRNHIFNWIIWPDFTRI